jgi:CO/xanthine dehydrogenase FAD-binding subunit
LKREEEVQDFDFYRADTVDEALNIMKEKAGKVKVIAGGTDVMIDLRNNALPSSIELILDISGVQELKGVEMHSGTVCIKGATLLADVASDQIVREHSVILHTAAGSVGSQQIRNRGTIGGNIVTAAQCADTAPALLVLDATVVLQSARGRREVGIADFFTGPKSSDVQEGELVTEIRFTPPGKEYRGIFEKLIRREAMAKSRLGVCVLGKKEKDGTIGDLRLSIGSSLPTHGRFSAVEEFLQGKRPDVELLHRAGVKAGEYMVALGGRRWSTDYKKPVVEGLTERCLKKVLEVE